MKTIDELIEYLNKKITSHEGSNFRASGIFIIAYEDVLEEVKELKANMEADGWIDVNKQTPENHQIFKWPIQWREIKFRAWIKTETLNSNGTRTNGFLTYDIQDIDFEDEQVYFGNSLVYPFREVVLQQYIGLKDKHDKEIYEGDIVKNVEYPESHPLPFEVKYEIMSNCNHCHDDSGIGFNLYLSQPEELEVVGNIYENPELLTGEK